MLERLSQRCDRCCLLASIQRASSVYVACNGAEKIRLHYCILTLAFNSRSCSLGVLWLVCGLACWHSLPHWHWHSCKRAHDFSWRAHRLQPSRFYNPALTLAQSRSQSESFAMIFSIIFALPLLLTHVAHALPNAESSMLSTRTIPTSMGATATYNDKYDNSSLSIHNVACGNDARLANKYPTIGSLPEPWYGSAPGVGDSLNNCGICWHLKSDTTGLVIYFIAIDDESHSSHGDYKFNMAKESYRTLNGGKMPVESDSMHIYAYQMPLDQCSMSQ